MLIAKLTNELQNLSTKRLQILLCLEIAQAYLLYGRIQKVEEYLIKARELAGLKLELTGRYCVPKSVAEASWQCYKFRAILWSLTYYVRNCCTYKVS